jgi:formylglycine-generating enzyme required for sulfatase activity
MSILDDIFAVCRAIVQADVDLAVLRAALPEAVRQTAPQSNRESPRAAALTLLEFVDSADWETQPHPLVALLETALEFTGGRVQHRVLNAALTEAQASLAARPTPAPVQAAVVLAPVPAPAEPDLDEPYPLLQPVRCAGQLGGRAADQRKMLSQLRRSALVALYAPSGFGKSSFLLAGVLPALRADRVPVAYTCAPQGVTPGTLLDELVDGAPIDARPEDLRGWFTRVRAAAQTPVLVLDQFEELFKRKDPEQLARVGRMLVATADVGRSRPCCRWVLAYREEFHGEVNRWLDGLGLALAGYTLPLPPLCDFGHAIRQPLVPLKGRWRFESAAHLERLAAAFSAVRAEPSNALTPLAPELSVVLNHLVEQAVDRVLVVPEAADALVHDALAAHLGRVLDEVCGSDRAARPARERTLLALWRLVDDAQRADAAGLSEAALGTLVDRARLDALSAPRARLLLPFHNSLEVLHWRLSHDKLAEVVAERAEQERVQRDDSLMRLARRVAQRVEQFTEWDGDPAALTMRDADFALLAGPSGQALLWDAARRDWWAAVAAHRRAQVEAALAELRAAEDDQSVMGRLAAARALGASDAELRGLVIEKRCFGAAMAVSGTDVEAERRLVIEALATVAQTADAFGHLVAGAELARHPETPGRVSWAAYVALREGLHSALRARFGGPSEAEMEVELRELELVGDELPFWVEVPGGRFEMGSSQYVDEQPVHSVTVSAFELSRFPVTRGLWAGFDEDSMAAMDMTQQPAAEALLRWSRSLEPRTLPMWMVTWFEAQAYACWWAPLVRLPTEAEWEYACRGGPETTSTEYWSGNGTAALSHAGWYQDNADNHLHAVHEKYCDTCVRHPLGLWDVHGSVREWTSGAHTHSGYPSGDECFDPPGARKGSDALRVPRGGSILSPASTCRSANRIGQPPAIRDPSVGLRLVRSRSLTMERCR